MAGDSRSSRSCQCDRGRYRTIRRWECAEPASTGVAENKTENARSHAAARGRTYPIFRLSPALAGRIGADDRAGVLLQRDLLHICAGADRLLRNRCGPGRMVHPAFRGPHFSRALVAWPAVRPAGAPCDDYADLRRFGPVAGVVGLSVLDRRA